MGRRIPMPGDHGLADAMTSLPSQYRQVLAVDTEARANFFEWVKKIYENSIVYEVLYDEEEYEIKKVDINGLTGDLYLSLVETETNDLIWEDEDKGVVLAISGYLNEEDILHIAESVFLCKTPN